jgi:alpha-L-arabinofuranosidase
MSTLQSPANNPTPRNKFLIPGILLAVATGATASVLNAQAPEAVPVLKIQADKVTAKISPTLYGLMTEEINYSYEGGLYGELIQNRIFRDDDKEPKHWTVVQEGGGAGTISLDETQPIEGTVLKRALKLEVTSATGRAIGVSQCGRT